MAGPKEMTKWDSGLFLLVKSFAMEPNNLSLIPWTYMAGEDRQLKAGCPLTFTCVHEGTPQHMHTFFIKKLKKEGNGLVVKAHTILPEQPWGSSNTFNSSST